MAAPWAICPAEAMADCHADNRDDEAALPMELGRVRFLRGSKRTAKEIASNIFDFQAGRKRVAAKKVLAENEARRISREEVTAMFSNEAIALAEVDAADSRAARELAFAEIRRTVDIVNFFAKYFEHPVGPHRAYVAPEGRGVAIRWAVYAPDRTTFLYLDDNPNEWAITSVRPHSRIGRRVGMFRVHELLTRETRSDLDDRIITAVAWAGRARTERRRELSFLLYAIALEALLTKPNARGGITERLRLRTIYLIHRAPERRRILARTMERLYHMRSNLVHSGASDDLADEDIEVFDRVVERAINAMLTKAPFKRMRDASGLEQWFDNLLLGA